MDLSKKDILKLSLIILLFLCLIVAWLAFGNRGFVHLYRMEKERQAYLEKIRRLENTNQELMEKIERLRKDKEYIESVARKELGLVRGNELIFRFSKDGESKSGPEKNEVSPENR